VKISIVNPLRFLDHLVARSKTVKSGAEAARRAALLLRACACIHLGDCDQAENLLTSGLLDARDAACLNLLGVICEKRGRWEEARRFYGCAIRADRCYAPPRQNIRRWFELDTFGQSRVPVTLGDEEPDWWCARRLAMTPQTDPTTRRVGGRPSHDN
jgi:hypothetical protein